MIEGLLLIIGEIFGQIIVFGLPELLLDYGVREARKNGVRFQFIHPLFAVVLYAISGYIIGIFSVYIYPQHIITNVLIRIINLLVTPVVLGIIFSKLGRYLEEKGKFRTGLETFTGGFVFALSMALARFAFAK